MSNQLAFDFSLAPLPHAETTICLPEALIERKKDDFIYGGGSAKEAEFFKMFNQLAAESNRTLHTVFEDFCLMGRCIVHNFGMQEPILERYMPKYEQCHTEYKEREKHYQHPQIILILNMLKTFLQLGILGLSVQIIHGNTLTLEAWDAFDTPNLQVNNCLGYYK